MKSFLLLSFVLAFAASARANFDTHFSAPTTTTCGDSYTVSADASDEEDSDDYIQVSLYKNGYLIAWNGNTGSAGVSVNDSGGGGYVAEMTGGGSGWYSQEVILTDYVTPTTPTNLATNSPTSSTIVLTWTASTDDCGVTGYEVKRDSTSLGTATGTSRTITGLTEGVTYQYYVRARDAAENWSAWSSALSVTQPDFTAPSAPQNLASPSHTATSVSLSWSASTDNIGVVAYDVYRTRGGITNLVPPAATGLSFTDTHVLPGTSYTYTVKARDAAGNVSAASSNSVTVTTDSLADTDSDGIPDAIESLFGNSNPTADNSLSLKTHRPTP